MFLWNLTLPLHSWGSKPLGMVHSNIQPNYLIPLVNKIKQSSAVSGPRYTVWEVTEDIDIVLNLEGCFFQ